MLEVFAILSLLVILALGCYVFKDKLIKLFIFCMCEPSVTVDWKSVAEQKKIIRKDITTSRRQPWKNKNRMKTRRTEFEGMKTYDDDN